MQMIIYLDVAVHIQRNIVGGKEQRLVIEQRTHVAIQSYGGLFASPNVKVEILGDAHHTINLPFHQQLAGFVHIVAVGSHVGFGRGIHLTDELTAHAAVAVINHRKRHFAHHLVGIDVGVE